ncbi:MAG: hypothetical protein PGN19_05105 [Pseudomonas oryzihabitans]
MGRTGIGELLGSPGPKWWPFAMSRTGKYLPGEQNAITHQSIRGAANMYERDDVICMACLATMAAAITGFIMVMALL